MSIIDGRAWRRQRIAALRHALEGDLDDAQRAAIEAELVELEATSGSAGRRWPRLLWGARLPRP